MDLIKLLNTTLIAFFICLTAAHATTYYVNGSAGSDANVGDMEHPFATIQKAADVMVAGDDCQIRKGAYRQTVRAKQSGAPGAPIRFTPFQNESVYITGIEVVPPGSWQPHSGSIYKADVSGLGAVTQVFVDEQQMQIARFPNSGDNLMQPTWGEAVSAVAQNQPALSQITDPLLAGAPDLSGGNLWLLTGQKWVSFSSTVRSFDGATISFVFPGEAEDGAYTPKAGSNYFISGLLSCLDAEKEWYYNAAEKTLYFYAPGGVNPAQLNVLARTREWGFDTSGRDYIEIADIHFFAAAVNLYNSDNCLLENSRLFYPVPFYAADAWGATEAPENAKYSCIKIGGKNNLVANCEVAYSWGEGIVVSGRDNRVENCLVHDINWLCTDAAPIHTSGSGHLIKNNTIYKAGRSGLVHRKSQALEIAYNHIYDCGLLTTDLGATYCYQTDGRGTIIHHNWVHDVVTAGHTAGIYLDNGSSNFLVHHNVVWRTDDLAIQTNLDAYNHEIYNNTLWDCSQAMGGGLGDILENQKVYNNLSNSGAWFGTDVQGNLPHNDPKFVDASNGDFRLSADSPARDDYIITAMLLNGGFESGVGGWTGAGCDLASVNDPVHSGNLAALAHNRHQYWEGARQSVTDVLKDHGPGRYTLEAWVKLAAGTTYAYLRFKLVDDSGEHYPGTQKKCTATDWTKVSYVTNLTWTGTLREAVFELMTTGGDELTDFYIDDCLLLTPAATDTSKRRGGILIPGITDDVIDGKPDAGAYEYGGANADWQAGSSLSPQNPDLPVAVNLKSDSPVGFRLAQNYPNPFNSRTIFRYELPRSAHVRLVIFNALGKNIKTLVDERQQPGFYETSWQGVDAAGFQLASGIYFYRCSFADGEIRVEETGKMMYIR